MTFPLVAQERQPDMDLTFFPDEDRHSLRFGAGRRRWCENAALLSLWEQRHPCKQVRVRKSPTPHQCQSHHIPVSPLNASLLFLFQPVFSSILSHALYATMSFNRKSAGHQDRWKEVLLGDVGLSFAGLNQNVQKSQAVEARRHRKASHSSLK